MAYNLDDVKKEILAGEAQLLDVRETNEWNEGHLTSSTLVPLSKLKEGVVENEDKLDQGKKTYLHCRSGGRVYSAQPLLQAHGFSEVIPLDQGFAELVENGFEQAK